MPGPCKYCLAVLGFCFVSCRCKAESHEHLDVAAEAGGETDFVAFLGAESPAEHVKHLYNESSVSESIFSWMVDASSVAACATDGYGLDPEPDEEEDPHAGHGHRRLLAPHPLRRSLLQEHDDYGDHDDHADHADHDDHDDHDDHGEVAAMRTLAPESLEALDTTAGGDGVTEALAYITACLIDPGCVLEQSAAAAAMLEDDHDDHDDHGSGSGAGKHIGLKVGMACAWFVLTVAASYLPLVFSFSRHYDGILSCLNAFSGSTFLTVGILHLLPHVDEYEVQADLSTDFPVGLSLVIIGFLLILFIEQVVFDVHGDESGSEPAPRLAAGDVTDAAGAEGGEPRSLRTQVNAIVMRYHSPLLLEAAVVLHAVLEGMVVGLTGKKHTLWLLFAAISSHKGFTAMSQSARFLRRGCPPGLLFILLLPFHLLPPLGILLGSAAGDENKTVGLLFSALATGTFLYIGAFEVISEEFVHSHGEGSRGGACSADHAHAKDAKKDPEASVNGQAGTAECCDDCAAEAEGGLGDKSSADAESVQEVSWLPSRTVKFAVYVAGCGLMFAITAALPSHEDLHGH